MSKPAKSHRARNVRVITEFVRRDETHDRDVFKLTFRAYTPSGRIAVEHVVEAVSADDEVNFTFGVAGASGGTGGNNE